MINVDSYILHHGHNGGELLRMVVSHIADDLLRVLDIG
jgi:hypothetical protein